MLNSRVVNPKVGLHAELTYIAAIVLMDFGRHNIKGLHTPIRDLVRSILPCSMKFAYCKRRLNAAETWQQGYELVNFVAQYSFLHCRAGLDESWTN